MEGGKLNQFIVGDVPTVMYLPNFITCDEEMKLLNHIHEAPVAKWKSLKNRRLQNWGGIVHEKGLLPQELPSWLTDITRRIYDESGLFSSAINHVLINEYHPNQGIMPHQDGPAYFPVVAILSLGSLAVMDFTPHSKLKLCSNDFKAVVKNRSFDGGDTETETKEEWMDNHHPFSVLLMPRSLLIFKDNTYSDYLHGIKDCARQQYNGVVNKTEGLMQLKLNESVLDAEKADEVTKIEDLKVISRTTTRVSLTCRLVPKVLKNLFKF